VGQAGGGAEEHGGVELLGQLEGGAGELAGLGGVGRLEHGELRRDRVVPVVLLVLGGVHGGVVRGDAHQATLHPGVGGREQRVSGHVDAHVLHRHQCARPDDGGAQRHLVGHLLVDGPLRVHVRVAVQGLDDLGGRGPRVPAPERDPGLPRTQCDGLVP